MQYLELPLVGSVHRWRNPSLHPPLQCSSLDTTYRQSIGQGHGKCHVERHIANACGACHCFQANGAILKPQRNYSLLTSGVALHSAVASSSGSRSRYSTTAIGHARYKVDNQKTEVMTCRCWLTPRQEDHACSGVRGCCSGMVVLGQLQEPKYQISNPSTSNFFP